MLENFPPHLAPVICPLPQVLRRSYSHAWANAGVFQTLLTSGPGTVCRGDGPMHCRTPSSLSGFGPLDANSTCSQLRRPNSSPDFASCSLRVKSLPPPLENPRVAGNSCFQLWEQEGAGAGPLQGEVTRPRCVALILTLQLAGRPCVLCPEGPQRLFSHRLGGAGKF